MKAKFIYEGVRDIFKGKDFSKEFSKLSQKQLDEYLLIICQEAFFHNIAKILIELGANVNCRDKEGFTPLMRASYVFFGVDEKEKINIVKLLLDNGANVNDTDFYGRTALDMTGSEEITRLLIKYNGIRKFLK